MNVHDLNPDNAELDLELKLSQRKGPPDDRWKKGPKITKETLNKAKLGEPNYEIQHAPFMGMVYKEITLGNEGDAKVSVVIKFGKYKGKTYQWIYENDKGYHYWACENIPNYEHNSKANITK